MGRKARRPSIIPLPTRSRSQSPPRPLGVHGSQLWDRVTCEYRIDDVVGREILAGACEALDRAELCKEQILRDGPINTGPGGHPRENPAMRHELQCRSFISKSLTRLGLDGEPPRSGPGRPPSGGTGISWHDLARRGEDDDGHAA